MRASRIWNGTLLGAGSAAVLCLQIATNKSRDALSTALWRGNLASIGTRSKIQRNVIIRFPGHVAIGSDCSIGSGSSLTAEREDAKLTIEDNVIINPDVHLDFTGDLRIGRNSLISPDVTVFTHSHGHDPRSKAVKTPLQIGESVWIGANTTICEGVGFIAANSIIAAGAVVTKEIREPGVYAGVPAKLVRSRVNGSAEF